MSVSFNLFRFDVGFTECDMTEDIFGNDNIKPILKDDVKRQFNRYHHPTF